MRLLTLCMCDGNLVIALLSSRESFFLIWEGLVWRDICFSNLRTGDWIVLNAAWGVPPGPYIGLIMQESSLNTSDFPNCRVPFAFLLIMSTLSWLKQDSLIDIFSLIFRGTYFWNWSLGTCLFRDNGEGKWSRNWKRWSWALCTGNAGLLVCLLKSMKPVERG